MGIWSGTISGNDYYLDIEKNAVESCEINLYDYLEDNSLLNLPLFNKHFSEISEFALKRDQHEGPLALGVLILKNGGVFPQDIKETVLKEINFELDQFVYEDPEYKETRQSYLREFKEQVENYKEGIRQQVKEESLVGISFKREFLRPLLEDMKQYNAPEKLQQFVELLLLDLKTPLRTISEKMGYSSIEQFQELIGQFEVTGKNILKKNKNKESQGFGIALFAQLLRDHVIQTKSIESFWLGKTNLGELRNRPELGEEYGKYYLVYKLSLFGKPYVGQCYGSLDKRAAQHIAQFKVVPLPSDL